VALFGLALVIAVSLFAGNNILDALQNSSALAPVGNTSVEDLQDNALAKADYLVTSVFFGLCIAIIIAGWFIGSNPIFFFIYFLVNTIVVVLSAILSNVWYEVTVQPVFSATIALIPKTNHLLTYLPFYMAAVATVGIIIIYAKPYNAGGGNL
jgi:hypothetical protein